MMISLLVTLTILITHHSVNSQAKKRTHDTIHQFAPPHKLPPPTQHRSLTFVKKALIDQGFPAEKVNAILCDPRLGGSVVALLGHPIEVNSWEGLKTLLLSPVWIEKGRVFLRLHEAKLSEAETKYGVSRFTILGILTIESKQGEFTGDWPALHVLYKRFLAGKSGSAEDLISLTKLCLQTHAPDCFFTPGSRAGAIGFGQFMPNNISRFGVDGNGDGVINPFTMDDAIMSTAKFLGHYQAKTGCIKKHLRLEPITHALVHYQGTLTPYQDIVTSYAEAVKNTPTQLAKK